LQYDQSIDYTQKYQKIRRVKNMDVLKQAQEIINEAIKQEIGEKAKIYLSNNKKKTINKNYTNELINLCLFISVVFFIFICFIFLKTM